MTMKPNFFLIGAPRSGTTAMSRFLQEHSQVYLCEPKEPFFWAEGFPGMRQASGIQTLDEYSKLFQAASTQHKVIGEASTLYLADPVAITKILDFCPDAKLMVILRNPLTLSYSFYQQLRRTLNEDAETFEQAWANQKCRLRDEQIPPDCIEPRQLQYKQIAAVGSQMERLISIVPHGQLLVIWHEDMLNQEDSVIHQVYSFLGIEPDGRRSIGRANEASAYRSSTIARTIKHPMVRRMASATKRMLPLFVTRTIQSTKTKLLSRPVVRSELSDAFLDKLRMEFKPEIAKLAKLMNRDLSHWLTN